MLITVAQTLFQDRLLRNLANVAPGVDAAQLTGGGAGASLTDLVPADRRGERAAGV